MLYAYNGQQCTHYMNPLVYFEPIQQVSTHPVSSGFRLLTVWVVSVQGITVVTLCWIVALRLKALVLLDCPISP